MSYNEILNSYNSKLESIKDTINNLPTSQECSVIVTENGIKEIVPEENYRFSKVTIDTNVIPDNSTTDLSGNDFPVISIKELDKTEDGAATFTSGYEKLPFSPKRLSALPRTLEATIYVPTSYSDQYWGCIVAWNDSLNGHDCMLWDVRNDNIAEMRLICSTRSDSGTISECIMRFVGALADYKGQKVHVALIIDSDNASIKLYVNGVEFTGTVEYTKTGSAEASLAGMLATYSSITLSKLPLMTIGGDWREKIPQVEGEPWYSVWGVDNYRYYRGAIYDVSLFSDVRTPEEIVLDKDSLPLVEDNILMSYDFTGTISANQGMSLRPGFSLRPAIAESKLSQLIDRTIGTMYLEDFGSIAVIGKRAFSGCTNLGYCEIPSSIIEIESKAFEDCSGLECIVIFAPEPPVIHEDTFLGVPSTCIFKVYPECLEYYKQADIWNALPNEFVMMEDLT